MTKLLGYDTAIRIRFDGQSALAGLEKTRKSFLTLKKVILTTLAGKVVRDMAQFGRDFGLMADRTGMSVQKLSGLRNAFISAGSGAKGFERTINNINDGLQGLAMGNGEQAAKLAMFGVSPYTSGGRLKQPDEILYGLADWAKRQKGRLSKEQILYRFRTLLNIDDELGEKLLNGAESFKRFRDEASKKMGEIDKGTQKKLDDVKTKWDELGGTISNTTAKVVADLQQPLSSMLDWSREIVKTAGDYPKVTAAVAGGWTLTTTLIGLAKVLGGASVAASGLVAVLSGLALAIGGVVGYFGAKLLDPLWEKIGDLMSFTYGSRDKLVHFKDPNGKLDIKSLEYWFDKGAITESKDKEQYRQALLNLYQYNPDKYQDLYADMMTDPSFKKEDESWVWKYLKWINPSTGLGIFAADATKALFESGRPSSSVSQTFEFNVMGDMTKDVAEQTMTMAKDATTGGLVPAGSVAK